MPRRVVDAMRALIGLCLLVVAVSRSAWGQKTIHCSDGDHLLIDVKQIAIQYDASSFAGTLSSLSVLSGRLEVAPKKLQEAAAATQQWDEFLKGLAAGYNSCAVSRQQYADGVNRIYPRLREDAADLEALRKLVSEGQKADNKRLQSLIDSFWANLRQFVQITGKEIILVRIEALSDQVASGQASILDRIEALSEQVARGQEQQKTNTELILAKFDELKRTNIQAPLATPTEVRREMSEVRKSLLAKVDEAESAYGKGYELLDRYRFREAIPYLQQALAAVRLPDFYLALGRAYLEVPDLGVAERVLREGREFVGGKGDKEQESSLDNALGAVLLSEGNLPGALASMKQALQTMEELHGPDHPKVAIIAANLGAIYYANTDLDRALECAKRAQRIYEKVYGPQDPEVADVLNRIGQILRDKGDLDGAMGYTLRALQIDEAAYGRNDPRVADIVDNIGRIYLRDKRDKRNLETALAYVQRGLDINRRAYGPEHPKVAVDANLIGQILQAKGDLERALTSTQLALQIDEKAYGLNHSHVATDAGNIGQILEAKGDLDGALCYTRRALDIDEHVFGPEHAKVAIRAYNIGMILMAKKDFDTALGYFQRAELIDERVYGPEDARVAKELNNIGTVFYTKGDLVSALGYTQRALQIAQKIYGPDHSLTKNISATVEYIKEKLKQ